MEDKKEYILCAAIWFDDKKTDHIHQPKNIKSGFVICGRRHHNCIGTLEVMNKRVADYVIDGKRSYVQGFITSKDNFVDRKEATTIAYNAKQVEINIMISESLFSEDLY